MISTFCVEFVKVQDRPLKPQLLNPAFIPKKEPSNRKQLNTSVLRMSLSMSIVLLRTKTGTAGGLLAGSLHCTMATLPSVIVRLASLSLVGSIGLMTLNQNKND